MPKHFLAVCLCIVALSGCQSTNQSSVPAQQSNRTDASRSTGDSQRSDEALRRSYANIQDRRDRDLLLQVTTTLEASDPSLALALLQSLPMQPANADLANSYHRLMASTKLRLGDALGAGSALTNIPELRVQDLSIIHEICLELGTIDCAVETKVMTQLLSGRHSSISGSDVGGISRQSIKSAPNAGAGADSIPLSNAARRIPQFQSEGAEINNTRLLWLDLHRTIVEAGSVPMAQNAWRNWRENNSRHSAAKLPPTPLQRLQNYRPPKISVLLPLSGRLTPVGNAVRNGFVTGYLADLSPREPTQAGAADITFFDSNQHDDLALVALSEDIDSDVIVGPIVKDRALGVLNVLSDRHTDAAAESKTASVVLLNRFRNMENTAAAPGNVYQFAAAIEDEALTLAENLASLGHSRLMVVSNDEPWAKRAKQALFVNWQGPIVEANFQQTKDLTRAIGDAMAVSDSQQRREQMAKFWAKNWSFAERGRT